MWTYVVKDDGTRKARAPCDGLLRIQETVKHRETNVNRLDQTASNSGPFLQHQVT